MPARSLSPNELLERTQWDFFWVPPDVKTIERPELAYLSCPRDRHYLNMVTRTRAAEGELPRLVDEVAAEHRGRRSRWLVPPTFDTKPLERALDAGGYFPDDTYRVSVLGCEDAPSRATPEDIEVLAVRDLETLEASFEVSCAAFGDPGPRTSDQPERDLKMCSGPGARVVRIIARDQESHEPLGCGNMTFFEELSFGLLWGGGTLPAARGRGIYRAVLQARVEAARRAGLRAVGLFANEETSSPIVAHLGFEQHGRATYWEKPA